MRVLVIVPAYNEAPNIQKVMNNLHEKAPYADVLVVNDCSTDLTERILQDNVFTYVSLPVNLGIGGCVQTGFCYALQNGYDIAVQFDGDGQHEASYIAQLIKLIAQGNADMVIGSRFIDKQGFQSSFARRTGIGVLSKILRLLCGVTVRDVTSGMRAVNRDLIKLFAYDYAQDYPEPESILTASLHGARIRELPVIMYEREAGVSSISLSKSAYYMAKVSLSMAVCRMRMQKRRGEG